MQINEFISEIRRLIAEGRVEEALESLIANKDFCNRFINDLILLKSRFSSNKRNHQILGLVAYSESNNTENQVSNALLEIIKKIENENLRKIKKSDRKSGELLYRIPSRMVLEEEVKCIIRIAYSLEKLIKDLKIDNETQIQSVQISEIMSVELLDINQQTKFSIRTCTDEEQFVIHEDFTQWIFFVTPLETGTHKLLIKISVIEVLNNKERKRNITLEKEVNISTGLGFTQVSEFVLIPLSLSRGSFELVKENEILKEKIWQLEKQRSMKELMKIKRKRNVRNKNVIIDTESSNNMLPESINQRNLRGSKANKGINSKSKWIYIIIILAILICLILIWILK